jgi:HK97 family phage prohead protease
LNAATLSERFRARREFTEGLYVKGLIGRLGYELRREADDLQTRVDVMVAAKAYRDSLRGKPKSTTGKAYFKRMSAFCLKTKNVDARFKSADDSGVFTIMAAAYGNVDRQSDVLVPGCVKNIDEFIESGWVAWQHSLDKLPIGLPMSASQDGDGFWVDATWHNTPDARNCRKVVDERRRASKRVLASIGYTVNSGGEQYERRAGQMVRVLSSINVFEASIVLIAANPAAHVVDKHSPGNRDESFTREPEDW